MMLRLSEAVYLLTLLPNKLSLGHMAMPSSRVKRLFLPGMRTVKSQGGGEEAMTCHRDEGTGSRQWVEEKFKPQSLSISEPFHPPHPTPSPITTSTHSPRVLPRDPHCHERKPHLDLGTPLKSLGSRGQGVQEAQREGRTCAHVGLDNIRSSPQAWDRLMVSPFGM